MQEETKCIITDGKNYIGLSQGSPFVTNDIKMAWKFRSAVSAKKFVEARGNYKKEIDLFLDGKIKIINWKHAELKSVPAVKSGGSSVRKPFAHTQRSEIYSKTEGKCALCGKFIPYDEMTVDHIVPLARGGSNGMENLQPTCRICNAVKQNLMQQEFMEKMTEIFIYQMKTNYDKGVGRRIFRAAAASEIRSWFKKP